jgi:hypothetical protein
MIERTKGFQKGRQAINKGEIESRGEATGYRDRFEGISSREEAKKILLTEYGLSPEQSSLILADLFPLTSSPVSKIIHHEGDQWILYSHKGKVLGRHPSKEKAEAQERAVEANKSRIQKNIVIRGSANNGSSKTIGPFFSEKEANQMLKTLPKKELSFGQTVVWNYWIEGSNTEKPRVQKTIDNVYDYIEDAIPPEDRHLYKSSTEKTYSVQPILLAKPTANSQEKQQRFVIEDEYGHQVGGEYVNARDAMKRAEELNTKTKKDIRRFGKPDSSTEKSQINKVGRDISKYWIRVYSKEGTVLIERINLDVKRFGILLEQYKNHYLGHGYKIEVGNNSGAYEVYKDIRNFGQSTQAATIVEANKENSKRRDDDTPKAYSWHGRQVSQKEFELLQHQKEIADRNRERGWKTDVGNDSKKKKDISHYGAHAGDQNVGQVVQRDVPTSEYEVAATHNDNINNIEEGYNGSSGYEYDINPTYAMINDETTKSTCSDEELLAFLKKEYPGGAYDGRHVASIMNRAQDYCMDIGQAHRVVLQFLATEKSLRAELAKLEKEIFATPTFDQKERTDLINKHRELTNQLTDIEKSQKETRMNAIEKSVQFMQTVENKSFRDVLNIKKAVSDYERGYDDAFRADYDDPDDFIRMKQFWDNINDRREYIRGVEDAIDDKRED